jgi:hypothetical protein
MRKNGLAVGVLFISLALYVILSAQERIGPAEAAKYIGKSATVCGLVASTSYALQSLAARGKNVFGKREIRNTRRYAYR